MEDLVVIGAGGHAKVVLDALMLLDEYRVAGVLALPEEVGGEVLGVSIIGTDADLRDLAARGVTAAVVGIGSVGECGARIAAAEKIARAGLRLPTIVHSAATVSRHAELAEGVFVAAGAVVGPGAIVGRCAIVNTGAVVDHDCVVGEFAHVASGATLAGGVSVGARVHVGAGAAIVQYLSVGDDALIGAGAVVVDDIESGCVAYGNPARVARRR